VQYESDIKTEDQPSHLLVHWVSSSGVKTRLGRITKARDAYIRSLLVLGARAVLNAAANKTDSLSRWAIQLRERRGYWKAVIAIAAKNARSAWAVLTKGKAFKLPA
jgi:transposase